MASNGDTELSKHSKVAKHSQTAVQSAKGSKYNKKILRTVKRKHRLWQRYLETRDGQIYNKFKKNQKQVEV